MKNRIMYFFLLIFAIFFIFEINTTLPAIWPDEVLFFSPAYDFSKNFQLRTNVLSGIIEGMQHYTYWMTPISMVINGLVLHFTGLENKLLVLRIFSSFLGFISVYIFYLILGNFRLSSRHKLIIVSLVILDIIFLKVTHTARMESFCLLFSNLALYFLTLRKKTILSKLLVGFFLACAFLSHPFGAVFGVLAFLYALYKKDFSFQYWILGSFFIFIFWFWYISLDFNLFLFQFSSQFSRKKELFELFSQITKLKIILGGFEFPTLKGFILFLGFLGIFFNRKKFFKNDLFKLSFLWFLVLLSFIYISTESWYVVYLIFPLSILISFLAYNRRWSFLVLIFFLFHFFPIANNLFILKSEDLNSKQNKFFEKIANKVSDSNTVYIQAIPDPFFYLKRKFPQKKLLEFVPNGVGIKEDLFSKTILNIDSFIFYNESLVHPLILEHLEKNKSNFSKSKIHIKVEDEKIIRFFAVVYTKNKK